MITFPNAKINIGLNIIEKRPDGFHNIESTMYPVKRYDALEAIISERVEFRQSGIEIPGEPSQNLCLKVYHLMRKDFSLPMLKIHLLKNIPIGAGLGGGSADAAFFIRLVNDLCELKLSTEQMLDYARKIGSDCAFFIENRPAFADGKGDQLHSVDLNLDSYRIEIIKPDIHISTAEAYAGVKPKKTQGKLQELIKLPVTDWKRFIKNDFEDSVFPRYPLIRQIKEEFYAKGALYASMSGSGSAVYGIFRSTIPNS